MDMVKDLTDGLCIRHPALTAGDRRSDPCRTYHKGAALAGERRQEQPALYNKGITAGQKRNMPPRGKCVLLAA